MHAHLCNIPLIKLIIFYRNKTPKKKSIQSDIQRRCDSPVRFVDLCGSLWTLIFNDFEASFSFL